jgi:ribonuclease HI
MSSRHDPVQVLRHLADTLDIELTLAAFPGMTREILAEIIRAVTASEQQPLFTAVLSVDGAARGNPGPAGTGMVLETADGSMHRFGEYLGKATNNVAEYEALLSGMRKASELGVRELQVRSDSELMVKQLNGLYKVKNSRLQELYFTAIKLTSSFDKVTFTHVPREENKEADRMANMAIDAKGSVFL